jgi:hypothetical protein
VEVAGVVDALDDRERLDAAARVVVSDSLAFSTRRRNSLRFSPSSSITM